MFIGLLALKDKAAVGMAAWIGDFWEQMTASWS